MKFIFILIIILIVPLLANSQTARVVERLESGAYVVEIDNVLYQALPPNKVREILADREKLNSTTEKFDKLIVEFNKYRQLSQEIRDNDQKIFDAELQKKILERDFYKAEYESEIKLRNNLSNKVKACTGKFIIVRLCWF